MLGDQPEPDRPQARGRARHRRAAARRAPPRRATITEAGLRNNISVGIQYLESWLRGTGAVAIYNLMEDAATAEISRSQVWQWLHNDVTLADGAEGHPRAGRAHHRRGAGQDPRHRRRAFAAGRWDDAKALFTELALADDFAEFLTLPAYERMP